MIPLTARYVVIADNYSTSVSDITIRAVRAALNDMTGVVSTATYSNYYLNEFDTLIDDFRLYRAQANRKGAYAALLPSPWSERWTPAPAAPSPPWVRQEGWRVAARTRHVTTSL